MIASRTTHALTGVALSLFLSGAAWAADVSTSVDFTRFTMGAFASADIASQGITVNGVTVVPTSGEAALADPSSVWAPLSGHTATFSYGPGFYSGYENSFDFTGVDNLAVGGNGPANMFKLGTLTFVNGFFSPLAFIDFSITTHSTDASLDNHAFSGRIRLDANTGSADPQQAADYFTIQDGNGQILGNLGSVRVYDVGLCPAGDPTAPFCNRGSVDLYGYINSLHLDHFANPTGGAFLNASTDHPLATAVPEPGTWALMALGGVGVALTARRRRQR